MSEPIKWTNVTLKLSQLKKWENNPAEISKEAAGRLVECFNEFGQIETLAVDPENRLVDGHQRLDTWLAKYGDIEVDCRKASRLLTEKERQKIAVMLRSGAVGRYNWDVVSSWSADDLQGWGLNEETVNDWSRDIAALNELLRSEDVENENENNEHATLAERFIVPPFSVLDARQGYWQDRKRRWIELGIQSEIGRGENLQGLSEANDAYRRSHEEYFSRKKDNGLLGESEQSRKHYARTFGSGAPGDLREQYVNGVLMKSDSGNDPAYYFKKQKKEKELGRELSTEEFQEKYYEGPDTYQSGTSIFDPVLCEIVYRWFIPGKGKILDPFSGGSVRGIVASILGHDYTGIEIAPGEYDLIFSCPPYADLEVYSDDPNDLSVMDYAEFRTVYHEIISKSVSMIKDNRFACFCVGDIRDKKGFYRNFPADTIQAFEDAGMTLYNEAILVTAVGSLPIRAGRAFQAGRKLGKTHQNVLVFYKGDPKKIREFGNVECGELEGADEIPD